MSQEQGGKAFGQRDRREQVWRSETAGSVGTCEEQEEFGINEPAETWGSGRSRRQRHKREVGPLNTEKLRAYFIPAQQKLKKLHWRKEYGLWLSIHQPTSPSKSTYFISMPVSSIKLWASCSNIPVFTGT